MYITSKCPRCSKIECELLATTNEWKLYCPNCDIRYNGKGEILNEQPREEKSESKG